MSVVELLHESVQFSQLSVHFQSSLSPYLAHPHLATPLATTPIIRFIIDHRLKAGVRIVRYNPFRATMNSHRSITHGALRKILSEKYPELFCIEILQKSLSTKHNGNKMRDVLDKLATLNGFTKLSKIQCPIPLAEGVVAVQRGQLMNRYTVYSRTTNIRTHPELTSSSDIFNSMFPPFREEDFTLYRNLESRLDAYLNRKKEAWMDFFLTTVLLGCCIKWLCKSYHRSYK